MKKPFAFITKFSAIFLPITLFCLFLSTPVMAFTDAEHQDIISNATELLSYVPEINWEDPLTLDKIDGVFTPLDASSYFKAYDEIDMPSFKKLEFDVNAATTSIERLNVQYASMLYNIKELGHGTLGQLDIPSTSPGYSSGIIEYFNTIYGDLSERANITAELPSGWNMEDLMAKASEKRNAEVQEAKNNLEFATMRDAISLSEKLAFAQSIIGTPELKTPLELNNMLKASSEAIGAEWDEKNQSGIASIQSIAVNNNSKITIRTQEELQDLFDTNVGETKTWLDMNLGHDIGSFNQLSVLEKLVNFSKNYESAFGSEEFLDGLSSMYVYEHIITGPALGPEITPPTTDNPIVITPRP